MEIIHRLGTAHRNADGLSRIRAVGDVQVQPEQGTVSFLIMVLGIKESLKAEI